VTDQTADALVANARRAVHESLALLPAWEADRVRSLIANLETAVESRAAIRCATPAVQAPAADRAELSAEFVRQTDQPDGAGLAAFEADLPEGDVDRTASPGAFVLWLDASDGSVPTHDGVQWPDGTATTHHSADAACQSAHGKQGRLVWAEPTDQASVLRKAADRIDREDLPQDQVDMFDNGARWATSMMRRMADEAQLASSSTPESPNSKFKENAKTLNSAIGAQLACASIRASVHDQGA
jgi:hypothetical protein